MRTIKKYWAIIAVAAVAIVYMIRKKAAGQSIAEVLAPVATSSGASVTSFDWSKATLNEKRNAWLEVLKQTGYGDNNTSDTGMQLLKLWDPNWHQAEILDQAVTLWPEIDQVSGYDKKYQVLNPILAKYGVPFQLSRVHKTGVAGLAQGAFSLASLLPGVGGVIGQAGKGFFG